MAKHPPLPSFKDQDAYIIGGGASLSSFDFQQLKPLATIGCNDAFRLGAEVCKIATFGDGDYFTKNRMDYESFPGYVATNFWTHGAPLWLCYFQREQEGLHPKKLGWNNNTGAMSVHLALMLGAKRVFLLGFDCRRTKAKTHWHDNTTEKQTYDHYLKFQSGFATIADQLSTVYPGREVYNVTDGTSELRAFPCCQYEAAGLIAPVDNPLEKESIADSMLQQQEQERQEDQALGYTPKTETD